MHLKYQKAIVLLISTLLLCFITPASVVANAEKTSTFQAQYRLNNQKLYVSVPPSLYDYYGNMSYIVNSDGGYASFVTPQAVEPIAESIENITCNLPYSNERFADDVLTLVHQIPYAINGPQFPVETLVDNSGDCVGLSLLAASIMQAGGLDVVLIHYIGINPGHMNVGVYLPYTPVYHTAGMAPTDFVYDNKTYWTAECTPFEDWKVGDQSNSLADATTVIIPLENTEQSSPAQVSSSLGTPLLPSSTTISLSQDQSSIGENTRALTISGSISPTYSGENVSIYLSSGSFSDYFTAVTDDAGGYMLTWNFTSAGTYYITTSWSGASNYAGADSETLTVFVGPESFAQFNANGSNYVLEPTNSSAYLLGESALTELSPLQGIDDFLTIPLGTAVSFSYDFTILQTGHPASNVQTETITIPASTQAVRIPGSRNWVIVPVPAETATVPVIPQGLAPLILPDDFNQTINDQFCFILQNSCGNYSLNVSALNDYEMSNITQGNGINAAFMNASENIKENTWYNVTESISGNGITANLYNTNGTLIETVAAPYDAVATNEAIMLIANNVDGAVILKDLTVKALNSTSQPLEVNTKANNVSRLLFSYVSLSILLVATFSVALVYVKKKRQMRQKNRSDAHPPLQI